MQILNAPDYKPAGAGLTAKYTVQFTDDNRVYVPLLQSFERSPVFARTLFISNLSANNTLNYTLNNVTATIPPYTDAHVDITGYTYLILETPQAMELSFAIHDYVIPGGLVQRGAAPLSASNDPYWANVNRLYHFEGQNSALSALNSKSNIFDNLATTSISTTKAKFGQSLLFDNAADSFQASTSGIGTVGNTFTIEFFIYFTSINSSRTLFLKGPWASGFDVGLRTNATANGFDIFNNGTQVGATIPYPLIINRWYFIACVATPNSLSLYVDGQFIDVRTVSNGGQTQLDLGNTSLGASFLGYIDELRQTNVARYLNNFTPPTEPFFDQ